MKAALRKKMEKECKGKIRFESMGRANKAARSYWHRFGRRMNAYKCHFCDGYHIGGRE